MSEQFNADNVLMAIRHGFFNELELNAIASAARTESQKQAEARAYKLKPSQYFRIKVGSIKPKYLEDVLVRFEHFDEEDNKWLVCTIASFSAGRYRRGNTVRLQKSHVGDSFEVDQIAATYVLP